MRTIISGVLILILWGAVPALAQLPPEIQVDFYLLRAAQAIDESDPARALVEIDKIILLQKEHELDLSDEFHFRYAQVAAAADLPEQALEAVVKYLTLAGRDGEHYVEALKLMNQAEDAIEASKEPQEASIEPSPTPQEASQAQAAGQLGARGTPERQEDKRALVTVVAAAEEHPAPEPETAPVNQAQRQTATQAVDCTKWEKYRFWKTATGANVAACLDAGADVNERGYLKTKPLHWAAEYNSNPNIIKALVAAGSSVDARNKYDNTPLHYAAVYSSNPEIIKALVAAGASLDAQSMVGNTPLHRAAALNRNLEIIKALLAAGSSLDARNKYDSTPLHLAAEYNRNPEVIRALLAAGANPNARNKKGKRPMDKARKRNRRILAAAGGTRTKKSGGSGGLGAFIAGTALAISASAAGASTEDAVALGGSVITGQQPAGNSGVDFDPDVFGTTGRTGGTAGGGSCEILGYPSPPGGVANLGFSWCPASVTLQVRSFALQAAGAQCAIATGSSSTPAQVQARRREIAAACGRLAALGVSNCRCPTRLGGPGFSQDSSSIDREQERREQQAKQQEEARQAAQRERQARQAEAARQAAEREKRSIEANNAEVLNSNCSCIRIKDNGEYTCLDGFVVGNNSSGKPLCDIRR